MSHNGIPDLITVEWLREHAACSKQVHTFMALWPQGTRLTKVNLIAAAQARLTISWLTRFLSAPARRAYDEAIAPVRRAYDEAIAPVRRAYDEAIALAQRAYDEAIALAQRAYDEASAPARRAYDEASALALADALNV